MSVAISVSTYYLFHRESKLESALFGTNKHSNSVFLNTATIAVMGNTEFECLFVANNADSNSISTDF